MIEIKDLIVLGDGAPNKLKDGRFARCICGYSKESGYTRIYPVPIKFLRRWDIFDVTVIENTSDHRKNTWKVHNSKSDWNNMRKWIRKKGKLPIGERKELLKKLGKDNLGDLIRNKESFGLIKPIIKRVSLEKRKEKTIAQTTLYDLDFHMINQKDFKFKPYVEYDCSTKCSCKNKIHKQQIVEWGCYEWMRRNSPNDEKQCMKVFDNLQLLNDDYEKYFLVGNIHKSPKTFLIVAVHRFKK